MYLRFSVHELGHLPLSCWSFQWDNSLVSPERTMYSSPAVYLLSQLGDSGSDQHLYEHLFVNLHHCEEKVSLLNLSVPERMIMMSFRFPQNWSFSLVTLRIVLQPRGVAVNSICLYLPIFLLLCLIETGQVQICLSLIHLGWTNCSWVSELNAFVLRMLLFPEGCLKSLT